MQTLPRLSIWLLITFAVPLALSGLHPALAQDETKDAEKKDGEPPKLELESKTFSALKARSIGPGLSSGRVSDIAVDPNRHSTYFVAAASGGVWKTTNNGTTYQPIFDGEGSYSIGCVTIDPQNSQVVWVGTGENNSQRSVSFGDGVYKSVDGGKSWQNMGLEESEHIGMIAIDSTDSDVVYVAAQGPLWRAGGHRGLYRTSDGGKSWKRVLDLGLDTGVNEVHLDPRDPEVVYASSYQRRRRVWTMINGGPESGLHKSTDGGRTWRKIEKGLPGGDKGKIGLDISPADPDTLYALVEASEGKTGLFRSTDRGESWNKQSGISSSAPMYYHELVCDPYEVDRVYILDTFLQVTEDGGVTFQRIQGRHAHVDNHALWIDPTDTTHLIVGCDGGIYESWDLGSNWQFKPNLPLTQFYRVSVDNSEPFFMVYGGTQDNATLGGPSRTTRRSISNEDFFVTVGGDGFETQVDPTDPNIVYSQWQYGGLVRHDRLSGENVDIKPHPVPGDPPHVFNWDAPLLISPHSHTRLYFGGRRLYRSEDRGNSWTAVSGDLSRGIDRDTLEVFGKVQPVNAIAKHASTSIYGNTVALSESPLVEGLLYVGTDDGLVHVSEDGGSSWRKVDAFPGVPHMTYVSCLTASRHDANTVYAAFDNHKNGDFAPYLLKSTDRGQSFRPIVGDLGKREIAYSLVEDHVRPDLLFLGTEFGAFYTVDAGVTWLKISGLPTIAVRDIDIQRRENDLAFATFGRGFYILDDYSPLQVVTGEMLDSDAHIFPVKDALFYVPSGRGRGSLGASHWTAENPPFGAVFTVHLKEEVKNGPKLDKEATEPEFDKLREKARTRAARVILIIRDESGTVVRRLSGSTKKGISRMSWDLRYGGNGGRGPFVLPGTYTVSLSKEIEGEVTELAGPESFTVKPLALGTFQPADRREIREFHGRVARLFLAAQGAQRALSETRTQLASIEDAVFDTPNADPALAQRAHELIVRLKDIDEELNGDPLPGQFADPSLPGIRGQIRYSAASWGMTAPPTETQRNAYDYAAASFGRVLDQLRTLIDQDLRALKTDLDAAGVPWTPGRLPKWERAEKF